MFEQMKIGVTLNVGGDAPQKIKDFHKNIEKLTKAVQLMEQKLKVTGSVLGKITTEMVNINPRLKEFYLETTRSAQSLKALNTVASSGSYSFTKLERGLSGVTAQMASATRQAEALKSQLSGVSMAAIGAGGAAGGGRMGGGGRRKGAGFGGMHMHPLNYMGFGFSGPMMVAGGAALINAKGFRENAAYQQEVAQMTLQNLPGASAQAVDQFVKGQNIPGVSYGDMAQALVDSAVITRDFGHAKAIAPTLAKMRFASGAVFPGKFSKAQEQAAIKVAEMITGSKDPAKLADALEHMFKVGTSSGWRVMPTDFLSMFKAARGNLSGNEDAKDAMFHKIDPDFAFYLMESIIQEIGGPGAGRQLAQAYNHIKAGRLTTASAKDFQALGLIKPGMAEYNKIGMIKRVLPGGIIGSEKENFFEWVTQVYLPALKKKGITSLADVKKHILIDFTNTDAGLVTTIATQQQKLEAALQANRKAAGIEQTSQLALQTPAGKMKVLAADWEKFLVSWGKMTEGINMGALDKADRLLQIVTKFIDAFNKIKGETNLTDSAEKQRTLNQFGLGFADDKKANQAASGTPATRSGGVVNLQIKEHTIATIMEDELHKIIGRKQFGSTNSFIPYQSATPVGTTSPF